MYKPCKFPNRHFILPRSLLHWGLVLWKNFVTFFPQEKSPRHTQRLASMLVPGMGTLQRPLTSFWIQTAEMFSIWNVHIILKNSPSASPFLPMSPAINNLNFDFNSFYWFGSCLKVYFKQCSHYLHWESNGEAQRVIRKASATKE